MKTADIIAAVFLFVGGINWGLVGLFDFNLVAISAIYDAMLWKSIQRRWECRGFFAKPEGAAA